MRRKFIAGWSG